MIWKLSFQLFFRDELNSGKGGKEGRLHTSLEAVPVLFLAVNLSTVSLLQFFPWFTSCPSKPRLLLLRGQTSASRVPTASACLLSRTCTCILQHIFPLEWVSFEVMHASAEVPFFSRASSSVRSACPQHSRSRCFLPWLRTLCAVPWLFLVSRAALTQEHLLSVVIWSEFCSARGTECHNNQAPAAGPSFEFRLPQGWCSHVAPCTRGLHHSLRRKQRVAFRCMPGSSQPQGIRMLLLPSIGSF